MGVAKTIESSVIEAQRLRPEIQRVLTVLKDPRYSCDLTLLKEMKRYMKNAHDQQNISAASFKTEQGLQAIAAQIHEVQRIRSRVIEIKFHHKWARQSLKRLSEVAAAMLRSGPISSLANQESREGAITWALQELRERMDDIETVVEMPDESDRHLGNAYFTLKELAAITTNYLEARRNERGT